MKSNKKRTAQSRPKHKHTKEYLKHYYPYLPLFMSIGLLLIALLLPVRQSSPIATNTETSTLNNSLLTATNDARNREGSHPLNFSSSLAAAAQSKADDMARRDYWSHTTPEGNEPWTFISTNGYAYSSAGENLAHGFTDSTKVVNAWLSSKAHRDNLLSTGFYEVGFGTSTSSNFIDNGPTTITVAMYASPKNLSNTVPQSNTQVLGASKQVSYIETLTGNANLVVIIAAIISIGTTYFLITHTALAHRTIRKSGDFIRKHPIIDSLMIIVISIGIVLLKHSGSIH